MLSRLIGPGLLLLLAAAACRDGRLPVASEAASAPALPAQPPPQTTAPWKPAERLGLTVLATVPHDPEAYTQGLVWSGGSLYESAGQYGRSSLRQVDPTTGKVLRAVAVEPRYFAEGLAQVGDRLIQLTWQEGVALTWRASTLERTGEIPYSGEGWGLCSDGARLVMSDGSNRLTFRDPSTLASLGGVDVSLDGRPLMRLNELECVEGAVWANVWQTDQIVRIDPATGRVTAVVDAAGV